MSPQDDLLTTLSETRRQIAQSPIGQARSRGTTYAIVHWASDTGGTEGLLCDQTGNPLSPAQLIWIDEASAPDALMFGGAYYLVEPTGSTRAVAGVFRRSWRILAYAGGGSDGMRVLTTSVVSGLSYGKAQNSSGADLSYTFNGAAAVDTVCISATDAPYTAGSNATAYTLGRPLRSIQTSNGSSPIKALLAAGSGVAFNAHGSFTLAVSSNPVTGLPITVNVGSGYSAGTGAFTAPTDGTYSFAANVNYLCNAAAGGGVTISFNDELSNLLNQAQTTNPSSVGDLASVGVSMCLVRTMTAGQKVTLSANYNGSATQFSAVATFSGFKIF